MTDWHQVNYNDKVCNMWKKYGKISGVKGVENRLMKGRGASNCYRAILAQVNYLESIYQYNSLKGLYEDLSELAYYIMEDDYERVIKGLEPIKDSIREIENLKSAQHDEKVKMIIGEIRTHLDYLSIEYRNRLSNRL